MELSKLKTELSKLSGVDFHSPKYREVFKRYFGTDKTETNAAENAQSEDAQADETVATKAAEVTEDAEKGNAQETADESPDDEETAKDETEPGKSVAVAKSADEDVQKTEDKAIAPNAEDAAQPEESAPGIKTEEESANAQASANVTDELLTTKLELELVRAGIREDRLETAKLLFMPEFKSSGGNTQQIRELIAQYPEWLGSQGGAQGFGMPLGDKADALTNEEKALKRIGINPRE